MAFRVQRQGDTHPPALFCRRRFKIDSTVVDLEDPLGDREAETKAHNFSGPEGSRGLGECLRCEARAIVLEFDLGQGRPVSAGIWGEPDTHLRIIGISLQRV